MRKAKRLLGLALVAWIVLGAATGFGSRLGQAKAEGGEQQDQDAPSVSGKMVAPDFTVTDPEGNSVKLSDMLGKPVVLNFWASWCPPCKAEMPDFEKVYAELGDEVVFMMVNSTDGQRETRDTALRYMTEQGYSLPVYLDTEYEASIAYGVRYLPSTLFIDQEGYIIVGAERPIDEETLRYGISLIQPEAKTAEYRRISAEEAKEMMSKAEPFILLDVRTDEEFKEQRIDGAILIPDHEIADHAEAELQDKDALILIYCRSGRRSAIAAQALVEMGYTQVYDFGGIIDWPYDTVSD